MFCSLFVCLFFLFSDQVVSQPILSFNHSTDQKYIKSTTHETGLAAPFLNNLKICLVLSKNCDLQNYWICVIAVVLENANKNIKKISWRTGRNGREMMGVFPFLLAQSQKSRTCAWHSIPHFTSLKDFILRY